MIEYVPGLENVPAAESAISWIDGEKGILKYRGILIEDLAEHSTFEETAFLLINGKLPGESELADFSRRVGRARKLSPELRAVIKSFPKDASPMAVLQACVAAAAAVTKDKSVYDEKQREESAVEFIGKFPALVAGYHRHRSGKDFVEADPNATHAADFLHMLLGEDLDPLKVRAMDTCLILHADHTMNASTFAT
ncbi:MAG TPA: citrate/2-methylcitrate synthase, partial [Candidatus Krumholzibacteria bacterium]|nr:citrate/2-methylcitrate synthase [Candidatus Krumholzibacteria bacterium]